MYIEGFSAEIRGEGKGEAEGENEWEGNCCIGSVSSVARHTRDREREREREREKR